MQIKLLELTLNNFKGLKDFRLACNGDDIEVHGDNATGKTTIYDGFLWLMFDKDSEGKKDFEIKTLDINNNTIHKLEHAVEVKLDIDGNVTAFRKVYKENWVKKHGTIEPVLAGHTTDYWIDDVPTKKKDYDTYISNLIDETTFKMLTDVRYFTEKINWKERRTILTSIAADRMDPIEFPLTLSQLIGNKSLEDFKKIIGEKKKKLKKELEAIPIRVDELNKNLPDIQGIDFNHVKLDRQVVANALEDLNNQGMQIIEHNNKLYELKSQLRYKESIKRDLESQLSNDTNKDYEQALKAKQSVLNEINNDKSNLNILINKLSDGKKEIERKEVVLSNMRSEWVNENKKMFAGSSSCPTCKQDLPEEEVQKIKENFETNKNRLLDDIDARGKRLASDLSQIALENRKIEQDIDNTELYITENGYKLGEIEKVLTQDRAVVNFSDSNAWIIIESEINDLNIKITDFKELDTYALDEKKNNLKLDIQRYNATLSKQMQYNLAMDRQNKLLMEEKTLANSINELEKQEFQIQEYTMKKINALENTVNNMFRNVKFKMFETQLNGGVNEVCEILINGVPYSSANYAGRINAGLDIINTLSKEYGTLVPVFVDNSESVTKLMGLEQQMIKLIVDSNYKQLAIIKNVNNIKEAV